jgi:hypothetical protein
MLYRPLLTGATILKSAPQLGYLGYKFAVPEDALLQPRGTGAGIRARSATSVQLNVQPQPACQSLHPKRVLRGIRCRKEN